MACAVPVLLIITIHILYFDDSDKNEFYLQHLHIVSF